MNGYILNQRVKKNLYDQRFIQFVVLTLQAVLEDVEHKHMIVQCTRTQDALANISDIDRTSIGCKMVAKLLQFA